SACHPFLDRRYPSQAIASEHRIQTAGPGALPVAARGWGKSRTKWTLKLSRAACSQGTVMEMRSNEHYRAIRPAALCEKVAGRLRREGRLRAYRNSAVLPKFPKCSDWESQRERNTLISLGKMVPQVLIEIFSYLPDLKRLSKAG